MKKTITSLIVAFALIFNPLYITSVNAMYLIKRGMQGCSITTTQNKLKQLGYFNCTSTGYFGSITENAVKNFQYDMNLKVDGIVGPQTISALDSATSTTISRNSAANRNALLPWFGTVEKIFPIGAVATVTDVETGKKFKIKRTYGYNHADCETLTAEDTETFKSLFSGVWQWKMRGIIVEYNGYKIAASIAGMPHAGREDKPKNQYVYNRSGGFGYGANLDAVKGNNMSGVIDVHFLGSKTHCSNKVDSRHQTQIQKAAKAIK